MNLAEFNDHPKKYDLLIATCGSKTWVELMCGAVPFESLDSLLNTGAEIWNKCTKEDWLEAFKHHPEIGNIDSLREKYAVSKDLSINEQSGVNSADEETLQELSSQNKGYKEKFGFIFIVFATGKSASEMLQLLNQRIHNSFEKEIENAMKEQWKITKLRLENLIV